MNVLGVTGVGLLSLADRVARQVLSLPQTLTRGTVSHSFAKTSASSFNAGGRPATEKAYATTFSKVSGNTPVQHVYTMPQAQANVGAFVAQMGKIFSESGIDLSREIDLTLNPSGDVAVANDHPDKAQIEELLENPSVKAAFRTLAAQAAALQPQSVVSGGQFHIALSQAGARVFFS